MGLGTSLKKILIKISFIFQKITIQMINQGTLLPYAILTGLLSLRLKKHDLDVKLRHGEKLYKARLDLIGDRQKTPWAYQSCRRRSSSYGAQGQ